MLAERGDKLRVREIEKTGRRKRGGMTTYSVNWRTTLRRSQLWKLPCKLWRSTGTPIRPQRSLTFMMSKGITPPLTCSEPKKIEWGTWPGTSQLRTSTPIPPQLRFPIGRTIPSSPLRIGSMRLQTETPASDTPSGSSISETLKSRSHDGHRIDIRFPGVLYRWASGNVVHIQPVRRKALEVEKPEYLTEEHLLYLDQLRESGVTNMFGAVPFILLQFPALSEPQAKQVLIYWMKSCAVRRS